MAKKKKFYKELEEIVKAAEERISKWPKWMQRPEWRQREPLGNKPMRIIGDKRK